MSGVSRMIERNHADFVLPMRLAETVKLEDDVAKLQEFCDSLQCEEGFQMEGKVIKNEYVSDEQFKKHDSLTRLDAPDEDYVVTPQTVRNIQNTKTELDENSVSPPQQFRKQIKMEESKVTTGSFEFVRSPQFVDSDNDQSEGAHEALVNWLHPLQASTKVTDDPQWGTASAVGECCKEPPYTCSICGEDFKTEAVMTSHITQFHHSELIFKCNVCEEVFFMKNSFKKHILSHAGKCGVCGDNFAELPVHMLIHTGEQPHRCGVCEKVFIAARNANTGCKNLISPNAKGLYHCDICGKEFRIWKYFTLHTKKHILTQTHLTCICSTTRCSSSDPPGLVFSKQEGSHKCVICGKLFYPKTHLSMHMKIQEDQYAHKSILCGKGFIAGDTNHFLATNKESSGGQDIVIEEPGICVVCRKYTNLNGYNPEHLLNHSGELPHNCVVCGKGYIQMEHLKEHILTHTAEKSALSLHLATHNVCGQDLSPNNNTSNQNDASNQRPINQERYKHVRCEQEFGTSALTSHLETHSMSQKVNQMKCFNSELTGKNFVSSRENYQAMLDITNDQNPCSFCDNQFQSQFELHLHLLTHIKGRLQDCDACVHGFTSDGLLLKHLLNHIESSMYDSCAYVIGVQKKKQSVMLDKKKFGTVGKYSSMQCLSLGSAEDSCNEQPHKCDVRQKGINIKGKVSQHTLSHTGEGPYKCGVCRKGFMQIQDLSAHILSHTRKRSHKGVSEKEFKQKCHLREYALNHTGEWHHESDLCLINSTKKGDLTRSALAHTEGWPYPCALCRKGFTTNSDLTKHMRTHTGERCHQCCLCQNRFAQKCDLIVHMFTHTGEGPHQCGVCLKDFAEKSHLIGHMLNHTSERSHNCGVCGNGFTDKVSLSDHMLSHTGEQPHKCSVCGKRFTSKSNLSYHMYTHTGEWPHKCAVCGKGFIHKGGLSYHMLTHTRERLHQCGVCRKEFRKKCDLMEHMLCHTQVQTHQCGMCGKGLANKGHLMKHMLTHTGEWPRLCGLCGNGFKQKLDLIAHLFTHTGEGPHQCGVCLKDFTEKSHLIGHMLTHTAELPHKCDVCGKEFTQKCYFTVHMYTHREQPHKCDVCGKGFTKKSLLTEHALIHTGEQPHKWSSP